MGGQKPRLWVLTPRTLIANPSDRMEPKRDRPLPNLREVKGRTEPLGPRGASRPSDDR